MGDLISIVVTLFNYKCYIKDLIESVLKQTHQNWELVIVDDGSTDVPMSVIEPYLKDEQIKYIKFAENKGYSAAKNEGIRNTSGNYIVMIDADDMLTENSLEIRYEALKNNPDKLWCHGEALVMGKGKGLSECSMDWKKKFRKKLLDDGMDLTKEYHHRLIHAQSVMVTRQLHKQIGLYDETLRFSSDNEMWRRVIRFGIIPAHVKEPVAIYRVHGERMSRSGYKKKRSRKVKDKIIKDVEKRYAEGINQNNTILWS